MRENSKNEEKLTELIKQDVNIMYKLYSFDKIEDFKEYLESNDIHFSSSELRKLFIIFQYCAARFKKKTELNSDDFDLNNNNNLNLNNNNNNNSSSNNNSDLDNLDVSGGKSELKFKKLNIGKGLFSILNLDNK